MFLWYSLDWLTRCKWMTSRVICVIFSQCEVLLCFLRLALWYLPPKPQILFSKLSTKLCLVDKNALYSHWTSFGSKTDIGRGSLRKIVSHFLKRYEAFALCSWKAILIWNMLPYSHRIQIKTHHYSKHIEMGCTGQHSGFNLSLLFGTYELSKPGYWLLSREKRPKTEQDWKQTGSFFPVNRHGAGYWSSWCWW